MKHQALCVALSLLVLASCERDEPGADAGATERCCVRGETKTLRFECEPGETAFVASACTARPDAGTTESSVVTCGDGKVDSTDECEGAAGCGQGTCINCTCLSACPAAPSPNPELLCSMNSDCPEGNGQCYACRCSSFAVALVEDAAENVPRGFDFGRISVSQESDAVAFLLRPFTAGRICVVEFTGNTLVAQICFFTEETVMAEFTGPSGSRLLTPNVDYGANLSQGLLSIKRSVLPLTAGDSLFIYNATVDAPRTIVDRVPDKGGISVDRLLGTR